MDMRHILEAVLILDTIVMIVLVLSQQDRDAGFGIAGEGNRNSYWAKNKGRSFEGRKEMLTRISAAAFLLLAAVLSVI